jgi:hypothetical protein
MALVDLVEVKKFSQVFLRVFCISADRNNTLRVCSMLRVGRFAKFDGLAQHFFHGFQIVLALREITGQQVSICKLRIFVDGFLDDRSCFIKVLPRLVKILCVFKITGCFLIRRRGTAALLGMKWAGIRKIKSTLKKIFIPERRS